MGAWMCLFINPKIGTYCLKCSPTCIAGVSTVRGELSEHPDFSNLENRGGLLTFKRHNEESQQIKWPKFLRSVL